MRGLSDPQQSTLIGVIARVPVEQARKLVLERVEATLPKSGRVTNEALLQAINVALKSFEPGEWEADEQGVRPSIDTLQHMTLAELARAYQRCCLKPASWCWPPKAPPTPEQTKQMEAKFDALPLEQRGEAYERLLYPGEAFEHHRAEEAERQAELARREMEYDPAPFPMGKSPPSTRVIRGEVSRDEPEPEPERFPTDDDLSKAMGEPEDEDQRAARAINEQLQRERLQRRRLAGQPKCFFR